MLSLAAGATRVIKHVATSLMRFRAVATVVYIAPLGELGAVRGRGRLAR